jgi:hypothetical protein
MALNIVFKEQRSTLPYNNNKNNKPVSKVKKRNVLKNNQGDNDDDNKNKNQIMEDQLKSNIKLPSVHNKNNKSGAYQLNINPYFWYFCNSKPKTLTAETLLNGTDFTEIKLFNNRFNNINSRERRIANDNEMLLKSAYNFDLNSKLRLITETNLKLPNISNNNKRKSELIYLFLFNYC